MSRIHPESNMPGSCISRPRTSEHTDTRSAVLGVTTNADTALDARRKATPMHAVSASSQNYRRLLKAVGELMQLKNGNIEALLKSLNKCMAPEEIRRTPSMRGEMEI